LRTIKLRLDQRLSGDTSYTIETEVLVEDDTDAEIAGEDGWRFLQEFQAGMAKAIE
jgi:hypothetical protein